MFLGKPDAASHSAFLSGFGTICLRGAKLAQGESTGKRGKVSKGAPSKTAVRAETAEQFLGAIETTAQKVLSDLCQLLDPDEDSYKVQSRLNDWAHKFHLVKDGEPSAWILTQACKTLKYWKKKGPESIRKNRLEKKLKWGPLTGAFRTANWTVASDEETKIDLPTVYWRPHLDGESLASFRTRVQKGVLSLVNQRCIEIESLLKERILGEDEKTSPQETEWAVQFLCLEEAVPTIVKTSKYAPSSISPSITRVCRLLNLDRRTVQPGPKTKAI
jgi:hypothetical protein